MGKDEFEFQVKKYFISVVRFVLQSSPL